MDAEMMTAWAVVENGAPLERIEMPMPEPQGSEVLLEVTHCGVCHSDLHIWTGITISAAPAGSTSSSAAFRCRSPSAMKSSVAW